MKSLIFCSIFLLLSCVSGLGLLDNFFGGRTTTESYNNEETEGFKCEDTRVLPRIASAIVGGSLVRDQKSVPYIVAIGERQKDETILWFCGGTLVAEDVVLTAAHCLSKTADLVKLGTTQKQNTQAETIAVDEAVIHPKYEATQAYHDIAVLRLTRKIKISRSVRPICIADGDLGWNSGQITSVIGWGSKSFGGEGSQNLQKVKVRIYNNNECNKAYGNDTWGPGKFPKGVIDEQLCAGVPEGGKDACQGDSGGPLVVEDNQGVIKILGIVSTGSGCGIKEFPGVYTRASSYKSWIDKYIR